jgi:hypothetical protein
MNGAAGGKCHSKTYKLNTLSAQADVDGIFLYDAVSLDAGFCAILLAMAREAKEFNAFAGEKIDSFRSARRFLIQYRAIK